jgi:uncharacterized protein YdbL (DUF1318 family)
MLKRIIFTLVFFVSACVTVNIYFPAAAVERAADQIVKETWGGPVEPAKPAPAPQSRSLFAPSYFAQLGFVSEAFAQEADINVTNPAIRALKESIRKRSDALKPYLDKGNVGIGQDGLLAVRSADGLNLKERAEVNQLIEAENKDREALYVEIAKANSISQDNIPRIKSIFARSWIEQARPGWWIQSGGNWQKK